MSRCGLDLMRLSKEVAGVQNLEPEVALLYSHAGTVHPGEHVKRRQEVYEALNFCGVPLGFVTDEQAAAGWLSKYKCLIVASARAVSPEAVEAIRAYAAHGGCVIAYGEHNLEVDAYGRTVKPVAFAASIRAIEDMVLRRDTLAREIAKAGITPEIALRTPDGGVVFGVEWRSAVVDGRQLVNLVNLTREPKEAVLPKGAWTDLITRKKLAGTIILETNVPVLAAAE